MATVPSRPFPVVLFTNSWAMGGMEEHLILLGRVLVRRGFKVAAICSPAASVRPLRDGLAAAGVEVHAPDERISSRLGGIDRLRALRRILKAYRGCVLHMHLGGPDGGHLVTLAGRMAGVRAVLRTEHVPPVGHFGWASRLRIRTRDCLLSRVIHTSEESRQAHLERLGRNPRKLVVVPCGIDLAPFAPEAVTTGVRAEFDLSVEDPVVGTVARLGEERKGIGTFLEMGSVVTAEVPKAQFLVVGDGPLRPQLELYAKQLGIADRVIFAGTRSDVPRLLATMDVFVMPSAYESGPFTLFEALSMGRAVVSTPVGEAPSLIEDGVSGRLAPIGDAVSMARAVVELLNHPGLAKRIGEKGREAVMRRITVDEMVDRIIELYPQACP